MDQSLLKSYLATVYELPTPLGLLRASLDGEVVNLGELPELLLTNFAILTAFNPRSMLLPRKVNEARQVVMRDMLVLGCYRVEACVGYEDVRESPWREPSWLVHNMDRDEAIAFGRVFRQNAVVVVREGRPEVIVTDPTCDEIGRTFLGTWKVRA
jgi:Protein of unknown function (DUF3293)